MKKCIYQLWIVRHKIHITQGKRENGSVTERRRNVKYLVISLTSVVILGGIWNLWHPKVWYIIFHHMKTSYGKQDENKVSTVKWNKNPFVEGGFCPDTRPSGSRDYSFQGCVLRSSLTDVRQKANAALVLRVLGSFILSSRPEGLQHWMNPVDMAEEKEFFFFLPLCFLVSYVGLEIDESQARGGSWRLTHTWCARKDSEGLSESRLPGAP